MSVNPVIENTPDEAAKRLRARAVRPAGSLTPDEVLAQIRRLNLRTPAEAAASARADRDGR